MRKYIIIILLVLPCVFAQELESKQQKKKEALAAYPMPWTVDHIWRRPLCAIWDRIQDKKASRKKTRPETLTLGTVSYAYAQGFTPAKHDLLFFAIDFPLAYLADTIMAADINLTVAHERVHYAEGDAKTIDHDHAVFKEFRAEIKGLQLWEHDEKVLNQILHGLYLTYCCSKPDHKAYTKIHPKHYETLLCWALLKQKQQHNADIDVDAFIKDFVADRYYYQYVANATHPFLRSFVCKQYKSWQGRLSRCMSAPRFIRVLVETNLCAVATVVALAIHNVGRSKSATAVGFTASYLIARKCLAFRLNLEYLLGRLLCRIFNSRLLWDKKAFRRALHKDALAIEEIVQTCERV